MTLDINVHIEAPPDRVWAVMRDVERDALAWKRGHRLLMDAPRIADAARQEPDLPVAAAGRGPGFPLKGAVDAHHAEPRGALAARPQLLPARGDAFVRVDHQIPVGIRQIERVVARGGEIVRPVDMMHFGP